MGFWPFSKKVENPDEPESRRPSNSKFKQQSLPAWQPILTASTVLPLFFLIGVVFLPIGITLLVTSSNIKEKVIEYSEHVNCQPCKKNLTVLNIPKQGCKCSIKFELKNNWDGDIHFYYGLTNFYQNHRRYVRSRDDTQLHGSLSNQVNSNCKPYDKNNSIAYAPCGAIANSMFSDTFTLLYKARPVPITYKNIAWKSDRETKFKNPSNLNDFNKYLKPKYWFNPANELSNVTSDNGFKNQDFIVWMRVAAFPTFRKLWRLLDRNDPQNTDFKNGLPFGNYELQVNYNYPVASFGGKKRFILTTSSWIGGKNSFLGTAYVVVGCLCLVFGFVFLVIHMKVRTRPLSSM